ncbi:MAG: hypothetical protein GY758_00700 [Fuerstiella sp.]|jgi:putative peptide zinc metalloprotease protein|nr:hypothetical protein [Fuerstiella sp.]MCP4506480.1 hypothetical protein [Fuerstiella sp.]MCP4786751.1 hypothetical protein [Fuerstiella sp.]MCP4854065.1 hypothetical protein [Fuerstiella sp.]
MTDADPQDAAIPWRMRRDLEVYPSEEDDTTWTLKDPVRLLYFRVEAEELRLLQLLDGRRSWKEAAEILADRFPESTFSDQNLQMFVAHAIRSELLTAVHIGHGVRLAETASQARSSAVYMKLFALISHRFRGIDPTALFRVLDRGFGWVFRPWILRGAVVFVGMMTILVISRWSQIHAELPTIRQLMTPHGVFILGATIVFIKILHEIGHGLTCHHYGGECHELGCIVVGFLPLLYCDVSDSWLQRNRMHRIHVAAAGIAVELFLAAILGMLWLASTPGVPHTFFFNVMLVCSLNTVLVNGNPLLRYDGYFVLCDLMRIPNLGPESRAAATSVFDRVVLGLNSPTVNNASALRRLCLPSFGAATVAYRLVVLATILVVIHTALKPCRLEGISYVLALSTAMGVLVSLLAFIRQRVIAVRRDGRISARTAVGFSVFVAGLGLVLLWPLPYSIEVPFTFSPGLSSPVYVTAPGYVSSAVIAGERVDEGQELATLTNAELQLDIAQVEGELKLRVARVAHLKGTRSTSETSAAAIPAAKTAVESSRTRLETLKSKAGRLTLRSPSAGIVYAPRNRPSTNASGLEQTYWSGTPLDAINKSTWLSEQTLFCLVGSPDRLRAMMFVLQQDVELVEIDAPVELSCNSLPGESMSGTVTQLSHAPELLAPPEITATGIPATAGPTGEFTDTIFTAQVRVNHSDGQNTPPLYSTGFARIRCQPKSLAARCLRILSHTFAFEL